MLIQIPKILFNIQKENNQLKGIINDFKIDGIISDNRYGMYSNDIPSVFITHQLEIQTPIFKNFIKKINNKLISRFSECWIPDFEINGIAGKLSRLTNTTKNYKYIGPLSRFVNKKSEIKYDILAIISGPEPQRSILEKTLIKELKIHKKKSLLLQGKPEKKYTDKINNLTIKSHLSSEELNLAMLESRLIICRSGYSTVMDLFKLQKNAILIPTPGQTEQEYLSEFLSKSNYFKSINQNQIKFKNLITKTQKFQKIKKRDEETNWNSVLNIFNK
jgi:UDP-N-acetylglucosamine:LPS N-acetylglucosamine transferase